MRYYCLLLIVVSVRVLEADITSRENAQSVTDTTGASFIVWLANDFDAQISTIQTAEVTTGFTVTATETISNEDRAVAGPVVAINTGGDIVSAWVEFDFTNEVFAIYSANRPNATGIWSSPVMISETDEDALPDLEISFNGTMFVLTWSSLIGSPDPERLVRCSTSTVLGTWNTPPVTVSQ